jgi:hypothetical protein
VLVLRGGGSVSVGGRAGGERGLKRRGAQGNTACQSPAYVTTLPRSRFTMALQTLARCKTHFHISLLSCQHRPFFVAVDKVTLLSWLCSAAHVTCSAPHDRRRLESSAHWYLDTLAILQPRRMRLVCIVTNTCSTRFQQKGAAWARVNAALRGSLACLHHRSSSVPA